MDQSIYANESEEDVEEVLSRLVDKSIAVKAMAENVFKSGAAQDFQQEKEE